MCWSWAAFCRYILWAYPISWRESCTTLRGAPLPMIRDFNHGTRPTTNPVIWPKGQTRFSLIMWLVEKSDSRYGKMWRGKQRTYCWDCWWGHQLLDELVDSVLHIRPEPFARDLALAGKQRDLLRFWQSQFLWTSWYIQQISTVDRCSGLSWTYNLTLLPVFTRLDWCRKRCLLVGTVTVLFGWLFILPRMLFVAVGRALNAFRLHFVIQFAWLLHEAVRVCPYEKATELQSRRGEKSSSFRDQN
jgi:hypothetical protein